ncbi:hypothetical protein BRYFOR_09059 [Marvinbryantia formatexigens DSM 14469]|uniref:Uncharacterized protein n=1 Tax=Marvinbryantia formatexigens DSM 14469 TaxID=478749 RepID=C6LK72_9FIRM|nr:hypothetical protein BRYFOR_09059 [Marvinbryantia formatexigens DSM 14469]
MWIAAVIFLAFFVGQPVCGTLSVFQLLHGFLYIIQICFGEKRIGMGTEKLLL